MDTTTITDSRGRKRPAGGEAAQVAGAAGAAAQAADPDRQAGRRRRRGAPPGSIILRPGCPLPAGMSLVDINSKLPKQPVPRSQIGNASPGSGNRPLGAKSPIKVVAIAGPGSKKATPVTLQSAGTLGWLDILQLASFVSSPIGCPIWSET